MNPVCTVTTHTGAVLDHTITDDVLAFRYKDVLTSGVGTFRVSLPGMNGDNYVYNDIALHDKVSIYVDYTTVPVAPNFVGYVTNITSSSTPDGGYIRHISGLSLGEILLRRFKTNKAWDTTEVDDIVAEVASDLGLGAGDIVVDATPITYEVDTKNYFDLLRDVSDYWVDAVTQVKKDFYVDTANDLVWAARPIRSVGVETLTVGSNILNYEVMRDVSAVKNNVTVYGAKERTEPASMDSWTESLTDWTALSGTLSLIDVGERKGTYCVRCRIDPGTIASFYRAHSKLKNYGYLCFWVVYGSVTSTTGYVRIMAPDTTNYFQLAYDDSNTPDWTFNRYALGVGNQYDVDHNPNGQWTAVGTPRWYDMQGIWFYHVGSDPASLFVDGDFGYTEGRYADTASNAASQTTYGRRDVEVTDDRLHSDSECEQRAETLLYQLKDPPTEITVTCNGNNNILIGDRLSMTIPSEGISAANYDVISVTQMYDASGWMTQAVLVNSANIREPVYRTIPELLRHTNVKIRNHAYYHVRIE